VKEINKINQLELDLGVSGASWHDEYKDSAYIFVGGLHFDLTEGDVVTIFSQYGEVMDVNLPRDKETGKTKGFGFLMYEDQRSTVLAVDNLNGAKVLDRTLRVDHVKNYKQPKVEGDDGAWVEPEEQSLNAQPEMIMDNASESDSDASSFPPIDPEDPMRDYLLAQRKEKKALKKSKKNKSKSKHKDETPEEQQARKARKKEKRRKQKSEGAIQVGLVLPHPESGIVLGHEVVRRMTETMSHRTHILDPVLALQILGVGVPSSLLMKDGEVNLPMDVRHLHAEGPIIDEVLSRLVMLITFVLVPVVFICTLHS
ncbi:RNA-binding motif protein, X-linked 2, partial [Termitomyces sp. J132]